MYKRVKINTRKKVTKRKKEHYVTGSGSNSVSMEVDATEEQLCRMNSNITKEIHNDYDDNAFQDPRKTAPPASRAPAKPIEKEQLLLRKIRPYALKFNAQEKLRSGRRKSRK